MKKILLVILLAYTAIGCKSNIVTSNPIRLVASATHADSIDGTIHVLKPAIGALSTFDGPALFSSINDVNGEAVVQNASAGTYTITISLLGYGTQKVFNFPFNSSNVAYAVLYPKFDYQEHITDIHTEDTIMKHPILVGVVVGNNDDTLNHGHIEFGTPDTIKAFKIIVSGTFTKPAYENLYHSLYGYLLIGKTKDISPFDASTYSLYISNDIYPTNETVIGDSTFSFTIYNYLINILHEDFKKGDNLNFTVYISPFNSYGRDGQTAHYHPPNSNNLVFPCFHATTEIKSTVLPW